ncbi:MAG: putative baseplate assembly protein [Planctomycetota bacterium]|jgi:hypothetical protein
MSKPADITCHDITRREDVLAHPTLNGVDYIEVPKDEQQNIRLYFIKPAPPTLLINEVGIEGGVRIRNIRVQSLQVKTDNGNTYLEVHVDKTGDFSTYVLVIDSAKVDVAFSRRSFSFKAGCPSDFDCYAEIICPMEPKKEPLIDYLAKDYASFRQALLDLIPSIIPDWQERHEADLGIALVELFAYVGDQLSYYQDAVANEAYLETARQRESIRRHARLIDYTMHDGANAQTFIQLQLTTGTTGTLPAGTSVLSCIQTPLESNIMPPHGPVISNIVRTQALSATDVVFETVEEAAFDSMLNEIKIHTWGNRLCCVPKGVTTLELVGDLPLEPGNFLLFEEVKGPETGLSADADPKHRQVVRLVEVKKPEDLLQNDPDTGSPPLKLTQVTWHREDALEFPLCISTKLEDGTLVEDVSVARGNVVLADHGQTIKEWHPADPNTDPSAPGIKLGNTAYRFNLDKVSVTFSKLYQVEGCENAETANDEENPSVSELMTIHPRQAKAAVFLEIHEEEPADNRRKWCVVPHLLDSKPFDRSFIVETKNNGRAMIRFGDDQFGMEPSEGSHLKITYRIGNGTVGNVGAETLVHVLEPAILPLNWPNIAGVRNPLPAVGGVDPESLDQVKLLAPKAFHTEQFRAVTEEDYARATEKHPEVDKAVATFRWTGSWHTVFITIDPLGHTEVTPDLEAQVRSHITRYKLAGYDIEIDPPVYVPLEIEINVCVARDHFRAHVKTAVLEALSNRDFADGRRGFFHPDNFTFGQSLYLSRLYEAIEQVSGVDSAEIIVFKRRAKTENHELEQGYISMGRLEIARLDNDPSFQENGVLRLNMMGGK